MSTKYSLRHSKDAEVIGVISRYDYLRPGCRLGLLKAAFTYFEREDVNFIIWAGGLISNRHVTARLKYRIELAINDQKARTAEEKEKPKDEREPVEAQKATRRRIRDQVLLEIAQELERSIPQLKNKHGKLVKIYIIIAPAINYDGPVYGAEIAEHLQRLRSDIVFWGQEDGRFEIKNLSKSVWVVLPTKAAWRSKYYSTRPDRLVEDKMKQTSQPPPDLWISDCAGVGLYRPAGELLRPQISPPALHRLQETTTSENQVGVAVVELSKTSSAPIARFYNFKDLVAKERKLIPDPQDANDKQKAILAELRKRPSTIGMLEDALPWQRSTIEREIERYDEEALKPGIVRDLNSGTYDVNEDWLRWELSYPLPELCDLKEDSFLGFGCLHVGYLRTQYQYFLQQVPRLMLRYNIRDIVGAGDYIAGLKHNLHFRGEVYAGMNYSQQERLAAVVVGEVILRVFRTRFNGALLRKHKKPNEKVVQALIAETLPIFYLWRGNHDEWVQDSGMEPLEMFLTRIKAIISQGVSEHLAQRKVAIPGGVGALVAKHVRYAKEHTFPSGLAVSIRHPHQGRMQTSSGRAQQTIGATKGQIVPLANFHTATAVLEWNNHLGQRVAMQFGTVVSGTEFEDGMNKVVDTGVGILKAFSYDGRIFMTEIVFEGPSQEEIYDLSADEAFQHLLTIFGVSK